MGEWHRNNPDLVGTEADPWMIHESYRKTINMPTSPPPSAAQIEEAERQSAFVCLSCDEIQPAGATCRECDGHLVEREG